MPLMYRIKVKGRVQGVGFRPFIYNISVKLGLYGYVLNTGDGVDIVVNNKDILLQFLKKAPPLARIDSISIFEEDMPYSFNSFSIIASEDSAGFSDIPADMFLCKDCLNELNSMDNLRYGYFFITCTNCGPRFSIISKTPYDRPNTSMDCFAMCYYCKEEYETPSNRRYHAQTVACPKCGPQVSLYINGIKENTKDPIKRAADLILDGNIVAIKGVGGFHLCCIASENIVPKLRYITGRPSKPFALMVKDFEMLDNIAYYNNFQKELLESPARPIVLLQKKKDLFEVSELDTLGVMLPYTGIHYLLFKYLNEPLVMTSSNMPDMPITTKKEEQFVNIILDHNRKIVNSVDDSVIKTIGNKALFIRRSRGYVPNSINIKNTICECVLALGGDMNNTICVVKGSSAYLSQHLGNLDNYDSYLNYKKTVHDFLKLIDAKPDSVVCDYHPYYNSSQFAKELSLELNAKLAKVQHHIAHIYSVAAENNLSGFVGIACDGLGFGFDGKIWGGEVFDVNNGKVMRVGSIEEQILIGGDSATNNPNKVLFSILSKFLSLQEISNLNLFSPNELNILDKQQKSMFGCINTTSTGRVLDAASAMLGFCAHRDYDGRPAMVLEAKSKCCSCIEPVIISKNGILTLTILPLFKYLYANIGLDNGILAGIVQTYIAEGMYKIACRFNKPIVFSGGCAYNRIITSFMLEKGVIINTKVPCGDGGLSFGQAAYYLSTS